jgi:hypothetical protein
MTVKNADRADLTRLNIAFPPEYLSCYPALAMSRRKCGTGLAMPVLPHKHMFSPVRVASQSGYGKLEILLD